MTGTHTTSAGAQKPLRLWPGIALVAIQWLLWQVVPLVVDGPYPMFGALACGVLVLVWWLFFSRAAWLERIGAIVLIVLGIAATRRLVHESMANAGMGMMLYVYAIPVMSLALVAGAVIARHLPSGRRRATLAGAILLGCAAFTAIRTEGVRGEGGSDLRWRWTPTPEERLLAEADDMPVVSRAPEPSAQTPDEGSLTPPASPQTPDRAPVRAPAPASVGADASSDRMAGSAPGASATATRETAPGSLPGARSGDAAAAPPPGAEWPGFRGPQRDGVVRGLRIETDWSASPPSELWRRAVGPGWSSFAVRGDRVYTQEQRGEHEIVSCYQLSTGEPVWVHTDQTRFWESNGGPGPRGTPTVHGGRVYTFGATGIVNALDAETGRRLWSRNAGADTGTDMPGWGFASSPLAIGDLVIVAASGRLVAYDAATGNPRWFGDTGGGGYSSPHLATIAGVPQVLLLKGARTVSVSPADGTRLWVHEGAGGNILQPALVEGGDFLVAGADMMGGTGVRRVAVRRDRDGWVVDERWATRGLKPYFNDFVVHEGYAYGFDGSILACIDLETGQRTWKGGRYGNGQMLLLADQDVLLVLSEDGELALVSAVPGGYTELAKLRALEGKTWNHPAIAGDILLVRNGQEMVAYRLPRAGAAPGTE